MRLPLSFGRDALPGPRGVAGAMIGPLALVGALTLLAGLFYLDSSLEEIIMLFGINAIMVVGYQVFVGNTGIVSFGHVAFMAVGAYAAGIVAIPVIDKEIFLPDLPGFLAGIELGLVPATLVGGGAAAVVAFLVGIPLMRLAGAAASIATLGLLFIVNNVIAQAGEITRGPQSLFGVPDRTSFFWVFLGLAVVVLIALAFKWSKAGLRARASRDDPLAAEAAGINVLRARLWPFVLSAFITGVGGALYAQLLTAFSPASFFVPQVVIVLTMAIIGGVFSVTGALTGAAVVTVLNEILRRAESGVDVVGFNIEVATGMSAAVLGIALIAMLRWRPYGLAGASELQLELGSGRAPPPSQDPKASPPGAPRAPKGSEG